MISLADRARFSWRHWDGELVLYDDASGVTRLVEGPVGLVLEVLTEIAPISFTQLEQHIAQAYDVAMDADYRIMLENALSALAGYGVVAWPEEDLARLHEANAEERGLSAREVIVRTGPLNVRVRSTVSLFWRQFDHLYRYHDRPGADCFVDFDLEIGSYWSIRHPGRQSYFVFNGDRPFDPLPLAHAMALFEWGLNWCVTQNSHRFLMLHAGVAARGDDAVLLPGTSGSGKSTLTTALCFSGWRLLSDELALLDRRDGLVYPMPRPLSLKNASIQAIRTLFPEAAVGSIMKDTRKGVVALVRPPEASLAASQRPARVRRILFPRYDSAAGVEFEPITPGRAFSRLYESSFNYGMARRGDFDCLADLVERAPAADLRFSDMVGAMGRVEDSLAEAGAGA